MLTARPDVRRASHTPVPHMTQVGRSAGGLAGRHTTKGITAMATWTWRDAPHDTSILGAGRLAEVELRRSAALSEAAAAREGERYRRTTRSRVGGAIVAIGVAIAGGAADVRGSSAARRRAPGEMGSAPRTG